VAESSRVIKLWVGVISLAGHVGLIHSDNT